MIRHNWIRIYEEWGAFMRNIILLLDVANLVYPLLHWRNLCFDSVTEKTQVCRHWVRSILMKERNMILDFCASLLSYLILFLLKYALRLLIIFNLTTGSSHDLRLKVFPVGFVIPETNKSLAIHLCREIFRISV